MTVLNAKNRTWAYTGVSGRCLADAEFDQLVDEISELFRARTKDPSIFGEHVLEDAEEQHAEHVISLLLRDSTVRVLHRLRRNATPKKIPVSMVMYL